MSSSSYELNVTLYRDSLTTPWGFRLEGGRDFHYPLTIQRVFAGSPACVDLKRGDMIVAINHRDASNMLHNDANDLIRSSGGTLNLGIKRGNNFTSAQYQAPTINKPVQNYKLDPFQFSVAPAPNQHNAFLKQQPNLPPQFMSAVANGPTYGPSYESNVENYVRSTPMSITRVRDPKPVLSQTGSSCVPLGLTQIGNRSSVKRYRPASTMPILQRTNYNEPGVFTSNYKDTNHLPFYDKKMVATIQQTLSKAVHSPVGNPIVTPTQYPLNEYYYQQQEQSPLSINNQAASPAPPVSFRSPTSMGNVPSLQTSNKVYSHHEVSQAPTQHAPFRKPDGPKVSHQQYNSPVGLYSREAFQEEFYKQVGPSPPNLSGRSAAPNTPISNQYQLKSTAF